MQEKPPLVTLSSDFAVQSHGVAMMHGVIYEICPRARVIDLAHGLPSFNLIAGARALETAHSMPKGFHVCVVDPGVGTRRKCIAVETGRGDFLIGPDNGVLLPAARFLGGITRTAQLSNEKRMRLPVSLIFHGRDVFAPAAAHLANGIPLEEFGPLLQESELAKAPYEEAVLLDGAIKAIVIAVNKFGSIHLNLRAEDAGEFGFRQGEEYVVKLAGKELRIPYRETFGDVGEGKLVMFKDDFGRFEIAANMKSLASKYSLEVGQGVEIRVWAARTTASSAG